MLQICINVVNSNSRVKNDYKENKVHHIRMPVKIIT